MKEIVTRVTNRRSAIHFLLHDAWIARTSAFGKNDMGTKDVPPAKPFMRPMTSSGVVLSRINVESSRRHPFRSPPASIDPASLNLSQQTWSRPSGSNAGWRK